MKAPQSALVVYSTPNAAYTCIMIMRLAARLLVALIRYCAMHAINVSQLAMLEHVHTQLKGRFRICSMPWQSLNWQSDIDFWQELILPEARHDYLKEAFSSQIGCARSSKSMPFVCKDKASQGLQNSLEAPKSLSSLYRKHIPSPYPSIACCFVKPWLQS